MAAPPPADWNAIARRALCPGIERVAVYEHTGRLLDSVRLPPGAPRIQLAHAGEELGGLPHPDEVREMCADLSTPMLALRRTTAHSEEEMKFTRAAVSARECLIPDLAAIVIEYLKPAKTYDDGDLALGKAGVRCNDKHHVFVRGVAQDFVFAVRKHRGVIAYITKQSLIVGYACGHSGVAHMGRVVDAVRAAGH